MPSLADAKLAFYNAQGYYGTLADCELAFFSANAGQAMNNPFGYPESVNSSELQNSSQGNIKYANNSVYFRVAGGGLITKIALQLIITDPIGFMSVGAYKNSGVGRDAVPDTLLSSSGLVPTTTPSYQEIPLLAPAQVNPGDWLAISSDSIICKFLCAGTTPVDFLSGLGRQYRSANHPLPAIAPSPPALIAVLGYNIWLAGS